MVSPNTNLCGNLSRSKLANARNWSSASSLSSQMKNYQLIKICLHYLFLKFIKFPISLWLDSFQEMHANSSWEDIPKNATCRTIPSLPLPPNHMWKHISRPNSLEHPLGAIFIPDMSYMSDVSLNILFVSYVS